ncbi:Retrovirus-related Pol polyprotein [Labeo rohita]|uniref:Retrovirus-related Pol polyprotein n=1 Tax=Labeo rohita TaxID=84645 RepID=A0ABQ8L5K7_LABRO|nr:Retrovirus-related Pol polyprotein [Labeo rohita]
MGNGGTERFNKTLGNMLRSLPLKAKHQWPQQIQTLTFAYNATIHETTGYAPFFLMFGRIPRHPVDIMFNQVLDNPEVADYDSYAKSLLSCLKNAMHIAQKHSSVELSVVEVNPDVHVYKIRDATGRSKVVHRNLLLEVNFLPIPGIDEEPSSSEPDQPLIFVESDQNRVDQATTPSEPERPDLYDSNVEMSTVSSTESSVQSSFDYSDELPVCEPELSPVAHMTLPGDLEPSHQSDVVDTVNADITQSPVAANELSTNERHAHNSDEIAQNLPPSSDLLCSDSLLKPDAHAHADLVKPIRTRVGRMRISPAAAENYTELKREILARLGLSSICAAQQFHEWEYKARVPARAQAADLARLAQHWLMEGEPTAAQVVERVVIDHFLHALPRSHRQAVGMRNPTTILELVETIELADAVQHREAGDSAPPFPRRVVQERRAPEGTPHTVSRPTVPSPPDEPMPTADAFAPPRTWLAGCIVHQGPPPASPEADVFLNGKPLKAILDSGSTVTLVQSRLCPPLPGQKGLLPITCVHGDTRQVPARRVTISAANGAWPVEAGLVKDLPVAVLLGRDWTGFDRLLAAVTQPASLRGDRRRRRRPQGPRRRPALLAFDVFRQAARGGSFAKAQREDDRLKHCWKQIRIVDDEDILPRPHPLPHFIVRNGLLYCVAQ